MLEQEVSRDSRERAEDSSILGRKAEGEALRNITSKLSEERNLRDIHLKHYHMSATQFKKRTTRLDIPGQITCGEDMPVLQFRKTETGRILRGRTSGRRIWRPHLFRPWVCAKIADKTFGFLVVLDEATSHLTAYPCKSTSPSEVIAKLHKWMDTFQINPKAICADMAFHHPHGMQASHRMHNTEETSTMDRTGPWPNRAEMGVRLFKDISLSTGGYSLPKNLGTDHSGTNHSGPVDAPCSNGEKYTGDLKW